MSEQTTILRNEEAMAIVRAVILMMEASERLELSHRERSGVRQIAAAMLKQVLVLAKLENGEIPF